MSACPEAEYRAGLPEEDFWHHVFNRDATPEQEEPDFEAPETDGTCSICRSTGACGYDAEGNPMIHSEGFKDSGD